MSYNRSAYELPEIYSSRGLSMSQLMTIFLLAKSLHFLVRIIPAVHTRGLHFTGLPFRSAQITKPVIQRWRHIWDENVTRLFRQTLMFL